MPGGTAGALKPQESEEHEYTIGTVHSLELHTYDDKMGKWIQQYMEKGWEMMTPPVFTGQRVPHGFNPHVGTFPHFVVLMRKVK